MIYGQKYNGLVCRVIQSKKMPYISQDTDKFMTFKNRNLNNKVKII